MLGSLLYIFVYYIFESLDFYYTIFLNLTRTEILQRLTRLRYIPKYRNQYFMIIENLMLNPYELRNKRENRLNYDH